MDNWNFSRKIISELKKLKEFYPRNFFRRAHPLTIIFLASLVLIILGGIIDILRVFMWAGAFIIGVYILYFIIHARNSWT